MEKECNNLPDLIRKHAIKHVCSYQKYGQEMQVTLRLYVSMTESCLYYVSRWYLGPRGLLRKNYVLDDRKAVADMLAEYKDILSHAGYRNLEYCRKQLLKPFGEDWRAYWEMCLKISEFMLKDRRYK